MEFSRFVLDQPDFAVKVYQTSMLGLIFLMSFMANQTWFYLVFLFFLLTEVYNTAVIGGFVRDPV
jgi:hypothetical protein